MQLAYYPLGTTPLGLEGAQVRTRTHAADAYISARVKGTHAADAILKKKFTKTHSVDIIRVRRRTRIHSVNAILKRKQTRIHGVNAVLRGKKTRTHSINTVLQKKKTVQHLVNAIKQKKALRSYSVDAALQFIKQKPYNVNTILRDTFTVINGVDFIVVRRVDDGTYSVSALIQPLPRFKGIASGTGIYSVTVNITPVVGEVMIAQVQCRPTQVVSSVPTGWTLVRSDSTTDALASGTRQYVYYKVAGSSEPGTYVWGFSDV